MSQNSARQRFDSQGDREPPRSERLREAGRRVERLLDEVESMCGPPTWAKVEDLVRTLLELHRAGLERMLDLTSDGAPKAVVNQRIGADGVVSSLLLLHGLHPLTAVERVCRALDELRPRLEAFGVSLRLDAVDETDGGVVRLRVLGNELGCGVPAVERALRRAIEEACPDLSRIEIEMPPDPRLDGRRGPIGLSRPERGP